MAPADKINYFTEDISFQIDAPNLKRAWVQKVVASEGFELTELNYIFCSDDYLLQINSKFLDHDTYTDIVTFDNSDSNGAIEGDVFISIQRVRENAGKLNVSFEDELSRVMIHGVLHLCGYDDKTPTEKTAMRKKEEACLSLR